MVRGGKTLRLLSDCRSYAVDLDRDEAARAPWQHAAKLMLAAAKGGYLEEVVLQFKRILANVEAPQTTVFCNSAASFGLNSYCAFR